MIDDAINRQQSVKEFLAQVAEARRSVAQAQRSLDIKRRVDRMIRPLGKFAG